MTKDLQRSILQATDTGLSNTDGLLVLNNSKQSSAAGDASQSIADARDLDELVRLALEQLCKAFHCDAAILLKQPIPGETICWASSPMALPELTIPGLPARLDEGSVAARVLKNGEMLSITEPGMGTHGPVREHTLVAVPMKTRDAVLGVIQLSGAARNLSDAPTRAALESLASKLADAVAKLRGQANEGPGSPAPPPALKSEANARLNLEQVYESCYRGVRALMACDSFFIVLYDEENHTAEFVFRIDNDVALPAERVPLGDGLIDYVLQTRRAAVVANTEQETRFTIRRLGSPQAVRSLICVPMDYGGKTIGALSAQSHRPNAYSEADVKVLTIFAEQTALTIHNVRLFAESQRRVEQLAVLNEVTRIVSSTIEIGRLLDLIFVEVRRMLPADTYYVALVDEQKQELKIEGMVDDGKRFQPAVVPLGDNLASYVIRHRAPLLLRNIREQVAPLGVKPALLGEAKSSESWLGVPMVTSEHLLGLLAVASYQPAAFDASDQELLQSVATQAAIAIDNARHHAEVEWQARHDSLTGALNHGYFLTRLREQVALAEKNSALLSLIMLDIDHFKEYNDSFGHLAGDAILRNVVKAILGNTKNVDLVGRWGGEEFVIAFPGCSRKDVRQVAERIRKSLSVISVQDERGRPLPVPTASQGIATFPKDARDPIALVDAADRSLYQAKSRGRDQISVNGD